MKIWVIPSLQNIFCIRSKPSQQVPGQAGDLGAAVGSTHPGATRTGLPIPHYTWGKTEEPKSLRKSEKASARPFSPEKGDFVTRGCFTGRH